MADLPVMPILCSALVAAIAFWNTVDINYGYSSGAEQVGLDWQVAIKLGLAAVCGIIGLLGLLLSSSVRRSLVGIPGIFLVLLAGVLLATSAVAVESVANVCRVTAVVNSAYLCFIPTALSVLGLRRVIVACLFGLVVNLAINWGMYFFSPLGVFEEELAGQTFVQRMGGLGHPNAIGRTAVLAALLSLAMLRSRKFAPRWIGGRSLLYSIICLAMVTELAASSRTALLAGVIAAGVLMMDKIFSRAGLTIALSCAALLLGAILTVELVSGNVGRDSFVSATTKTGDIEELTSATGRTAIWAESIRLISQRPITGYGINSAPVMLEDFSQHTHNLVLHATFSGGIFAGILILCLLAWNLFAGVSSPEPLVRAISVYVLFSGIFEDTVLDTFASPSTLLWTVVMLYPSISAFSSSAIESRRRSAYNGQTIDTDVPDRVLTPA